MKTIYTRYTGCYVDELSFTYEQRVERSDYRKYVCVRRLNIKGRFSNSWGLRAGVSFFPFPLHFFFRSRSNFCAITRLACLHTPYIKNKNSGGFIDRQCKGVGMGEEENRRARRLLKRTKGKIKQRLCTDYTTLRGLSSC